MFEEACYILLIYGGLFGAVYMLDRMAKKREEKEHDCCCGKCHNNEDENEE